MKFEEWIEGNAKLWQKADKERYYFLGREMQRASVYFSLMEEKSRYRNAALGGYICASKCYNGATCDQINELLKEYGVTIDFKSYS